MRQRLQLYAPVIVLLALAALAALGVGLTDVALWLVLGAAVFLHIRAQHDLYGRP